MLDQQIRYRVAGGRLTIKDVVRVTMQGEGAELVEYAKSHMPPEEVAIVEAMIISMVGRKLAGQSPVPEFKLKPFDSWKPKTRI